MFLTWFLGGVAVSVFVTAMRYRNKWNKSKNELVVRSQELANALGEVGRVKIQNERLECFLDIAKECLPNGYPVSYDYAVVGSEFRVCVFGRYNSYRGTETTACIKAIPIENGDEEFAIREAEELIEIINKF